MGNDTNPADPNQGFPNPHSDAFDGERTPAEQYEFDQQEKARQAAAGAAPADVPANPTGTPEAAF